MRYTVHPVPTEHLGWIIQRTGCIVTSDFRAIAALDANGLIRGMIGYCNWTQNAVQMHAAIDSFAAARALLIENDCPMFHYPFIQEKRGIAIGIVRASNEKALQIDKHVGFREVHRIKDGAKVGEDLVVLEMRREECRWLKAVRKVPVPTALSAEVRVQEERMTL